MIKFIVKAKHWQIFALLVAVTVGKELIEMQFLSGNIDEIWDDIFYIFYLAAITSWPFIVGISINNKFSLSYKVHFRLFIVTCILLISALAVIRLSTPFLETPAFLNNTVGVISFIVCSILSISILYGYPSKALKAAETKGDVGVNDYFNYIFFMIFWPIGVWFIQPRVNKIFKDEYHSP